MVFSVKYPTCIVGEEPEAGLIRMDEYKECEGCFTRTEFMDMGLLSYTCSDECRKKLFHLYLEVANGG